MANYATELEVRLRYGFHEEQVAQEGDGEVAVGATTIKLNKRCYSVLAATLNGTALVVGTAPLDPGEYEFVAPKKINLGTAVISDDYYDFLTGIELPSSTIEQFLDQATQIVKSFLRDRFGDAKLLEWETTTPPMIERLTAMIAGNDAERSMLRKGHKFDPKSMEILNTEYNRLMKMLKDLKTGVIEVPDEDELSDLQNGLVVRGLSSFTAFATLSDMHKVDMAKWDRHFGTDGSQYGSSYRR